MVTFLRPEDPPEDDLPKTFIDLYVKWAHSRTDAPIQYHKAVGASILSTVMCPYISLRTNHGITRPNIWVMILAGTTMTRKSTSMDYARYILDQVVDDYLLANDGSPEGLLAGMGMRDGKVSLFHRDEIVGFMKAITHKEYMQGTEQSLTRLYDGQPETRTLRRETIEIKNPYLVILSGGIKSDMEETATMSNIRTGFLPRFIFVTGTTSREKMRHIGPPSDDMLLSNDLEQDVVTKLWAIRSFYSEPEDDGEDKRVIRIAGIEKPVTPPRAKHVHLQGTPEFWERLRLLEEDAWNLTDSSSDPTLYAPIYERLKESILKVAILICGADLRDKITEVDLQVAIRLGESWLETATNFAHTIEQHPHISPAEKKLIKIAEAVRDIHPKVMTQTQIMQRFHFRKSEIPDVEETLVARNMVEIMPWPHPRSLSGAKITYHTPASLAVAKREDREDSYVVKDEEKGGAPIKFKLYSADDDT